MAPITNQKKRGGVAKKFERREIKAVVAAREGVQLAEKIYPLLELNQCCVRERNISYRWRKGTVSKVRIELTRGSL